MRLAVFSDSHGRPAGMRRAIEAYHPDHIIFLGDGVRDAEAAGREHPRTPMIILRGNCDWAAAGYRDSILFELGGVRIFAAHGHRHDVKLDLGGFYNSVCCSGARLGLYGHTHRALIGSEDGVFLMNPGSIGDYPSPTFGLVSINNGDFKCEIIRLDEEIR